MSTTLLTLAEAAARLHVCTRTLRNHINAGRLPYIAMGGGLTRQLRMIHPHDLMEFVERQRRTDACPSISPRERKPTSTTSSIEVVDFAAIRAQRRSEKQRASSDRGGRKLPA